MTGDEGLGDDAAALVDALHLVRVAAPPPLAPLAAELSGAAGEELELLFGILREGRVPAHAEVAEQILSETQTALVLCMLAEVPGARVSERALAGLTDEWTDLRTAAASLRVLGAVGHSAELEAVLSLAAGETELVEPDRVRAFQECLTGMLGREAACLRLLELRWRDLPDVLLVAAIEAVAAADRPAGLYLLSELLTARPDLASRLVPRMRTLARAPARSVAESAADALRPYLRADDETLRASACLALAGLDDTTSVPELLELLEAPEPSVRDAAHYALRSVARTGLPPRPALWREWYAAEQRWATSELPELLQQLDAARPDRAARALAELVRHPLQRHVVARAAAPLLRREIPWLQTLVARTLGELGSTEPVPALLSVVEQGGRGVLPETARSALVAITGDDELERVASGYLAADGSAR